MNYFGVMFSVLALVALVAVLFGYTHHIASLVICVAMAAQSFSQHKKDRQSDQKGSRKY